MTQQITWQDCIHKCDELIELLKQKMIEDPKNGVLWQEKLAIALYKRQTAMAMKRQEERNTCTTLL